MSLPVVMRIAKTMGEVRFDHDEIDGSQRAAERQRSRGEKFPRRQAMAPVISVLNVSKSFPGVRALSHVRFELLAGEVHALVGENGAGKSTLMKILAGIYPRNGGEILYKGEPVNFASPRAAQMMGIGI